jgi:hypothetical protein
MKTLFILIPCLTLLLAPIICNAESLTGGYSLGTAQSISYLRLTQHKNSLVGYIQSITANDSVYSGYTISQNECSGSVEGRSITLYINGTELDGTFSNRHIVFETPFNGYVARLPFNPITVERWNHAVSQFTQLQALRAGYVRVKNDYTSQVAIYQNSEKNLPGLEKRLTYAQKEEQKRQKEVDAAQVDLDKAQQAFIAATAKARATQDSHDEVEAGHADVLVGEADAHLSSVRDNSIGGLAGAKDDVANATMAITDTQHAQSEALGRIKQDYNMAVMINKKIKLLTAKDRK